ncbi:hypothetical protein BFP97_07885 [Roseivirga sp. 4D4]|uniref:hypothetical protein n=1 Tax=Roseivirga sp. 4D4 TaxID=1889784 RepID=UPI0008537630|nr:hypothetical protein [Roseivirga sp. 4D4]OEK01444.1 hypothetical protein BFP97_07885 [Roseivirga sp. 4D4]
MHQSKLTDKVVFRNHTLAFVFLCLNFLFFLSCENEEPQPTVQDADRIEFASSATFLVADGSSTATFDIGFFDQYGRVIEELQSISSVVQNGQVVSSGEREYSFTPETPGSYKFQLLVDNEIVANHIIYVLENQKVEIPVIFHVSENEPGDISERMQEFIDKLNAKFSFQPLDISSSQNLPSQFSFVLAEVDEAGQALNEIGIDRYNSQHEVFSQSIEVWQREYYWNPESYVNFWIGKRAINAESAGRTHFPDDYHFSLPDVELPQPRWEYRIDYGDTPPTHQPEGIKYGYRDGLEELTENNSVLNYITLLTGKFMGLEVQVTTNELSESNYMAYYGSDQKDHFTAGQNGRMWFIINYARWRARKGLVHIPIN